MPTLSPDVGAQSETTSSLALRAHLLKATRSQDLDEAFEKVLSEYLELKIAALQETTDRLEEKWGMEFSTFKQRLADDDLPARFVEGEDGAMPGQGGVEGSLVELEEMKAEYYDVRGWVDGVVPDEKLTELGIDVGPGTGVSTGDSAAPADD